MTVFIANTNLIELSGLTAHIDGEPINNATVTVTIFGPDGEEVDGASWPVTMAYVDESDGDYRAVLSHALDLLAGKKHIAMIDANGGSGRIGHWEFPFRPQVRTG